MPRNSGAPELDASLLAPGGHVVAAVSGGADSMALLSELVRFARRTGGTITAATLDHGLRPDSARDVAMVRAYCRERGVSFAAGRTDVRARVRARGETVEQAARAERYAFLERVRASRDADTIATGHTRDDQVETVLMRLLRGTGLRGLRGIPRRRGTVVRPMLHWRRADTEAYCDARNIPVSHDPTNTDTAFTRNAVRADLVPRLARDFPGLDDRLTTLAWRAQDLLVRIRETTDPILAAVQRDAGRWVLELAPVAGLDRTARAVLLGDLLEQVGATGTSRAHVAALESLCATGTGSGRTVSLPGATARREYDDLILWRGPERPLHSSARDAFLAVPGDATVAGWRFSADVVRDAPAASELARRGGGAYDDCGEHVAYFGLTEVPSRLTVRSPRPGDRMMPFGMRGTKKLSDIWTDRKVPRRRRETAAVVEHDGEIAWLAGVATSERVRVAPNTPVIVRVRARRVEFRAGEGCNE